MCENLLRIGFRNEYFTFTSQNDVDLDDLHILKIGFKISHKISHSISYKISHKIFPQDFLPNFPSWILIAWLPITLFQMLNFCQSLPFLNWLFPLHPVLQDFPTRLSSKIFPQDFPTRFSHKIFRQVFSTRFPTRFSHKIFPQDFPARFSHKIFPQDFSARFPTRFPTAFHTRFSCKISHQIS